MRRFFIENIKEDSKLIHIMGEEFTHLKKVLRLNPGDEVCVFNGKGLELKGVIDSIDRDSAVIKAVGSSEDERESQLEIILIQGFLKGDKPELVIQKATELGVSGICFFLNARTVPVLSADKIKERLSRWKKVSIEAAKQCGRTRLPRLEIKNFEEALSGNENTLKLILWEEGTGGSLKEALKNPLTRNGITVLIGPEGGLSEEDVETAKKHCFVPVSFGPRILRAETAAISALSVLQYEAGDLG